MDSLIISALTIETRIGVHAWEQHINQKLVVDVSIPTNFSACEDNLANTIDYDDLCQQITTYVQNNNFKLIETVAEQVAALIKNRFKIDEVTVSVSKPHAIKNAANIKVTVKR